MARTHEEIMKAARANRGESEYTPGWSVQNVSKNFAAFGELFRGKPGAAGADGTSGRLGDRVPEAPDYSESPTGIQSPTTAEGDTTVAGAGQGIVSAESARAHGEYRALEADKVEADALAASVQGDIGEIERLIDEARTDLDTDRVRFLTDLKDSREAIQGIPTEITSEFDRLRDEFGDAADASFDRIDSERGEALANVEQGRSEAMQAAVQGIQGNVNNQVAKIMANPDMTSSQKQSMVSQVKLSGASSIAPAIGQTVHQFNALSAEVATRFGAITGQVESTILSSEAHLTGLQGQSFAAAQTAVGQMTTQLLEIDAGASASFAASQNQLLATRSHAAMTGNDILLRTLPEQSTPYLDLTGAATAAYEISADIIKSQFAMDLQAYGMDVQIALLRQRQGNPITNILDAILKGFVEGGPAGAVLHGGGAAIDNLDPNREWI